MPNERSDIHCDRCGQVLEIGMHPFCPHGFGGNFRRHDDIPGGITLENYGPQPVTFYSHTERRAYMQAHGLQEKEKFCPLPGTDRDPQGIPNPKGYMDPQTLENARILLSRHEPRAPRRAEASVEGVIVNQSSRLVEDVQEVIRVSNAVDPR